MVKAAGVEPEMVTTTIGVYKTYICYIALPHL